MTGPRCEHCRFFQDWRKTTVIDAQSDGECRRFPPQANVQDGSTPWRVWPAVNAFDWCGGLEPMVHLVSEEARE